MTAPETTLGTAVKTEFVTSEGEHWYPSPTKPGVWYPSVTTVIGGAFPKGIGFQRYLTEVGSWDESRDILNKAGKRGTNVHKATEILESGGVILREYYTLEEWQMLMGFVDWHRKFKPVAEAVELSLCSDKLKTGGTIDRVYIINGERIILDIKTSSAIHDNYWAQTSAYVKLYNEYHKDRKVDKTAILRLAPKRKDGYEYKTHDEKEINEDFVVFKAVLAVWKYLNPKAKPALLEVPLELKI